MKFLFIHRNFPAQFLNLISYLSENPEHEIFFITTRPDNQIKNVKKIIYKVENTNNTGVHTYLKEYNEWIQHGQAVAKCALMLKNQGFTPDIIYAHHWGGDLFIKDVYPDVPYLCYLEWYTNAYGTDLDFNRGKPLSFDNLCEIRIKNSPKLVNLSSCDHCITPTYWQFKQYPEEFHHKISVIHDGVCTNFFHPEPDEKLVIPEINLDLSHAKEIVTYATSGMEPYRGFPQFMEAAAIIQKRRPDCHIVVGGHDCSFYSEIRPDGKTFKQYMMETLQLDLTRIHFTGFLNYKNYLKLLQCTNAHVYLTYPYILSWSLIESLGTGALVIGSDTAPVREVIKDGENGFLVDFFKPEQIADRVDEVFANPEKINKIKANARKTIQERYNIQNRLAETLNLINTMVKKEKIDPKSDIKFYNLGLISLKNGNNDEAKEYFEKVLKYNPSYKDAYKQLGDIYYKNRSFTKAMQNYEQFIKFDDKDINVFNKLGQICSLSGYIEKCIGYFAKVFKMQPYWSLSLNNLLLSCLKNPAYSQKEIYDTTKSAVDAYLQVSKTDIDLNKKHKNIVDKTKKIHIGYLSTDFCSHVVMRFFEPILANYDKNRFSITLYSNTKKPDHVTQRCRNYADNFKDIKDLKDKELAELIENDGVDILVDLGGHSGDSRVTAMAFKPAPVQATYLGYPNTTGLSTVDYIITDKITIKDAEKEFFAETPFALDFGYECYNYVEKIFIDVASLPAKANNYVTFGYFNCLSKLNTESMKNYAEVLKAVPASKFLLHRIDMDEERKAGLYKEFNDLGISSDRLLIKNDRDKALQMMNTADIALDSFPYNGTTTTIESVIMGLPVVCIYGNSPHSRPSARINTALGLQELIAKDKEEFVKIAAALASDTEKLAKLREGMRERLLNSALLNHSEFVKSLEKAYIQMWENWCDKNISLDSGV